MRHGRRRYRRSNCRLISFRGEEGEAARDRLARRTHVRGESNRISRLNRGGRGSLRKYVIEPVNKDTRNRWQAAHFRVRAHAHRGKRKRSAVVVAHRPRFKSRQIYRSVRRRAEATKGMTSRSYARVSAMCVGKEAACWRNEEREREAQRRARRRKGGYAERKSSGECSKNNRHESCSSSRDSWPRFNDRSVAGRRFRGVRMPVSG